MILPSQDFLSSFPGLGKLLPARAENAEPEDPMVELLHSTSGKNPFPSPVGPISIFLFHFFPIHALPIPKRAILSSFTEKYLLFKDKTYPWERILKHSSHSHSPSQYFYLSVLPAQFFPSHNNLSPLSCSFYSTTFHHTCIPK